MWELAHHFPGVHGDRVPSLQTAREDIPSGHLGLSAEPQGEASGRQRPRLSGVGWLVEGVAKGKMLRQSS